MIRLDSCLPALALLLAFATPALAERLELIDGTVLTGRIRARNAERIVVRIGGAEYSVPREIVAQVFATPGERDVRDPEKPRTKPDRILLRDGGILVGQIVQETSEEVTVTFWNLADGPRSKRLPRSRILRIEYVTPPPLSDAAKALARRAIEVLASRDRTVRVSAAALLRSLGPRAKDFLVEVADREATPTASRAALRQFLGLPPEEKPPPSGLVSAAGLLESPEEAERHLTAALQLSGEQRAKVREILAEGKKRHAAGAAPEMLAGFLRTGLKSILTDVQYRILEARVLIPD